MSIRIGVGIAGFPFDSLDGFLSWVDSCEASDIDSVWFSERLVSREPMLEPLAACAVVAGRTRRLKVGFNAIVLPFRDPLVLAKECATIDVLSGGRLLPVFGVGDERAPEFSATGRSPVGRGARADEMLDIMTALWRGESVTYEGAHFQYRDARIAPLPLQQPLPVWIGGSSDAAIRRTARIGTGWLAGLQSPESVAETVARIRRAVAETGRPFEEDHFGAGFAFRFGKWDEPIVRQAAERIRLAAPELRPERYLAVGDAETIIGRVREYIAAGCSKFVLRPIAMGTQDMLEQTERLAREVIPAIHG